LGGWMLKQKEKAFEFFFSFLFSPSKQQGKMEAEINITIVPNE
jgi:hypothetical protein